MKKTDLPPGGQAAAEGVVPALSLAGRRRRILAAGGSGEGKRGHVKLLFVAGLTLLLALGLGGCFLAGGARAGGGAGVGLGVGVGQSF